MIDIVHDFFRIATTACAAAIGVYYIKKYLYQSLVDQQAQERKELEALDAQCHDGKKELARLIALHSKDLLLGDRLLICVKRWGDIYRQQQHDEHIVREHYQMQTHVQLRRVADALYRQEIMSTVGRDAIAQARKQLTAQFADAQAGNQYLASLLAACKEKVDGTN